MNRALVAIAISLALIGAGCSQSSPSPPSEQEGTGAEANDPTKNDAPSPQENGDGFQEAKSPEKDGVRLTVRVPNAVTAGLPLPIDVKVANNGNAPVFIYWRTSDPTAVDVALTTRDGKPVPFTQYGRKKIAPTELADRAKKLEGSIRELEVAPGKTGSLSEANLGLFYDLTLPGEYDLTVRTFVRVSDKPIKDVAFRIEKIPFTIKLP